MPITPPEKLELAAKVIAFVLGELEQTAGTAPSQDRETTREILTLALAAL